MNFRFYFLLLLLFSLTNFATAQTPTEKPGTASISGKVTAGENPVPDVLLTLMLQSSSPMQRDTYYAKTEENGSYKFSDVKAGRYTIIPMAPAYVPIGGDNQAFQAKMAIVNEGEAIENLDINLATGGVITGKVIDSDGRPVIAQQVTLFIKSENSRSSSRYSNWTNSQMFLTDDRGIYRIYGLPAHKYLVAIGDDVKSGNYNLNSATKRYPLTYYPSVTAEENADVVEVTAGSEATNIDITLGNAHKLFEARGKIIDANSGQPLVAVRFLYGPLIKENNQSRVSSWMGSAERTNNKGEFVLRGLTSANYSVQMQADEGSDYYSETTSFEIKESNVSDLEIKAQPGATISGIVVVDGETKASALALFKKLRVVYQLENNSQSLGNRPLNLNADGTFQLHGVRPGKMRLYITFADFSQEFVLLRTEKDGVELPASIEVTNKTQLTGIRMIVAQGTASIRGQVNIIGGTIPANTIMRVFARQTNAAPSNGRNIGAEVDVRGRFIIEKLFPGEYEVTLNPVNIPNQQSSSTFPRKWVTQNVTVSKGAESSVVLTLDLSEEGGKQ